jgi:RNA polymerase sigma factor (TIGR02999 family)
VLDSFTKPVDEVTRALSLFVSSTSSTAITRLLQSDDVTAERRLDQLLPLVYDELRALAHRQRMRERSDHTLSTTALIHEAYIKLVDHTQVAARGRAYFFGAAARAMRQILVDYARRRGRQKRAGQQQVFLLEEEQHNADDFAVDVLALHDALEQLATIDERSARIVECRYFGGLSTEETAEALDISARTVKRDWTMARAWLFRTLRGEKAD